MEEKELKAALAEMKKELERSTGEEYKTLKQKFDDLEKSIPEAFDITKNEEFNAVEQEITALKTKTTERKVKTFADIIKESKDEINSVLKGNKSEVVIKASTVRASVVDNPRANDLMDIGQLATAKRSMRDLCTIFPMSGNDDNGIVRYSDWNAATSVRAAAMIAEGGTFPESTAKWATYSLPLKKVGDTIPLSEELVEDSQAFANELNDFLRTNVAIKENDQILNGDGTDQNLTGLITSIPAYTPTAKGISSPKVDDLVVVVRNYISKLYGGKYTPNFVLMNSDLIEQSELAKDNNNNYIMPPFKSADGTVIKGMMVVEENSLADNTMVVGDSRYMRLYVKGGLVLSKGEVNAQFTSDMTTLKARQRELFLIREVDKTGFLKVTSVSEALTIIGS